MKVTTEELLNEKVAIVVTRDTAQKLKLKAVLVGLNRQQFLEKIANEKN